MTGEPKAELHVHVEGTASPRLAREMAAKYGVAIDDLVVGSRYRWEGFSGFLRAYDRVAELFRTEDDYRRLAAEYLIERGRDGTLYCELTVSPDHARAAGLSTRAYLDALAEGARQAEDTTGIVTRLVAVGVRHLGPEAVEAVAREIADLRHTLVTGFGLAGDERLHAPADFRPAFTIAGEAGLGLTAHAGEFAGPQGVRETIDALKVSRIGHGVRAIEDADLVRRIAAEGITLEVCPGSNLALGVFRSPGAHPLRRLHEAGVRVSVHSDDPPFFGTDLAAEYAFAANAGFTAPERLALTRNAIEAAFVDEPTRQKLLERMMMSALTAGAPGGYG